MPKSIGKGIPVKKPVVIGSNPSENWKQFLAKTGDSVQASVRKRKKSQEQDVISILEQCVSGERPPKEKVCKPIAKGKQDPDGQARLTKVLGLDCEMVGVEDTRKNMLARVSIVNKFGECVFDKYVQPSERVVDYRTWVSGVRPRDLKKGEPFEVVRQEVLDILKDRIVVGHAVSNDFKALKLPHPKHLIRDTSKFDPFRKLFGDKTPSLKKLARMVLGVNIQSGEHSSVQDAKAALQLYLLYQQEWEVLMQKRKRHRRGTK